MACQTVAPEYPFLRRLDADAPQMENRHAMEAEQVAAILAAILAAEALVVVTPVVEQVAATAAPAQSINAAMESANKLSAWHAVVPLPRPLPHAQRIAEVMLVAAL